MNYNFSPSMYYGSKMIGPFLMSVLMTPVTLFVLLWETIDLDGLPPCVALPLLGVVAGFTVWKYYYDVKLKREEARKLKLENDRYALETEKMDDEEAADTKTQDNGKF